MATNKIKIIREITGPEKRGNLTEQAGYCNIGNRNTGDWNTGDCNTGEWNTSNSNIGNFNAGEFNTGNLNTGNRNTGNHNTGDWNTGDWNTGCFNTNRNPKIKMFNKPSNWTMIDWMQSDARDIISDLFREAASRQDRWDKLSKEDKATVMSLPNFDADIFTECTGIRV